MKSLMKYMSQSVLFACSVVLAASAFAVVQTDGPLVGGVSFNKAKVFLRTNLPADVQIEYSVSPNLLDGVFTDVEHTLPSDDFTRIIELSNLLPNTIYYYRVVVDGQPQQVAPYPRFKTFPFPNRDRNFGFAVVADVGNAANNPAQVYETIANFRPGFLLQIGDWDHRDPSTLSDMRKMHREVRGVTTASGFDFNRFIASAIPIFHVWDDHDYGMNDGDYTFEAKPEALQAFYEYYPTADELPNPEAGIWQKFSYAQAEFYMLDVRSNRDPNGDEDNSDKSMLNGEGIRNDQKSWLLNSLLRSTAKWKFVTSGVNFNPTCKPADSWGAFTTEWAEIVNFVKNNNISGVIILSGDLHSGGAIDDGTNSGLVEFSVPHTNMQMPEEHPTGVTTVTPGVWSEGLDSGVNSAGFAWVQVSSNPDRVSLEVRDEQGALRKSYLVTLEE